MIQFSRISSNRKTGYIPVSGSESKTCPSNCPLKKRGCYAKYGHLRIHWTRLDKGQFGYEWSDFLNEIKDLPKNQLWRHNQFGDLPGTNNKIDSIKMAELVEANKGKRGFTYTHKPIIGKYKESKKNRDIIKNANEKGFTVNISCDNLAQLDKVKKLKDRIGPTVVIAPKDSPKSFVTKGGNKVVICPAQYMDKMTCEKCRLCSVASRGVTVGFWPHGNGQRFVAEVANRT